MHFITSGYKHLSKTNSTDPRQRVPLTIQHGKQQPGDHLKGMRLYISDIK